jgi:hypothetical protein
MKNGFGLEFGMKLAVSLPDDDPSSDGEFVKDPENNHPALLCPVCGHHTLHHDPMPTWVNDSTGFTPVPSIHITFACWDCYTALVLEIRQQHGGTVIQWISVDPGGHYSPLLEESPD